MAVEISLNKGRIALIDDKDFDLVNQYKWCAHKRGNTYYAVTNIKQKDGSFKSVRMHRLIMNPKSDKQIDHKDGNGLNNQRSNLRECFQINNLCNQRKQKNTSSVYKGVYWFKRTKIWRTQITSNYKHIHLGYFNTEIEAAKAYDKAALELFGKYAKPNFGDLCQ